VAVLWNQPLQLCSFWRSTELNGVGENTEFDFVARGQLEGGDKQKTGRFIVAGILSFVSFPCSALFVIVLGLSLSPDPQVFKLDNHV
jgi:hypothetical protein